MKPHARITRRHFLAGAAATGVMVGCTRKPSPVAPKDERALGVALLGLGSYATSQLAPGLQRARHCSLRGIITGSPEKIPTWQHDYGVPDRNVYSYDSFAQLANNHEIDVVYVVTPTALHMKYAVMAAEAGKHVWCEKPMAMNEEDCQTIIDACRKNKVSLAIGYRMQHEPNTQTIAAWGKAKPYGAIKALRADVGDKSDEPGTWRMKRDMGGGALYDIGVYSINAIRYASGEEPVRVVSARQWTDRPEQFTEVDEHTEFQPELPSGLIAHGFASRGKQVNQLRVEAERGWYGLEPFQQYTGVRGETSDGKKLDARIDHEQAKQMDDDAVAILNGKTPLTPGEEGMRDIHIINAVQAAVASGGSVEI